MGGAEAGRKGGGCLIHWHKIKNNLYDAYHSPPTQLTHFYWLSCTVQHVNSPVCNALWSPPPPTVCILERGWGAGRECVKENTSGYCMSPLTMPLPELKGPDSRLAVSSWTYLSSYLHFSLLPPFFLPPPSLKKTSRAIITFYLPSYSFRVCPPVPVLHFWNSHSFAHLSPSVLLACFWIPFPCILSFS